MRSTMTRILVTLAALLLIFAIAFGFISSVTKDNAFFEEQYASLGISEQLGISVPDLSRAASTLMEYMRGEREDILVGVQIHGQTVRDLFYHEKEVVHMEEVRLLWSNLRTFAWVSLAAGLLLLSLAVFFGDRETKKAAISKGILTALIVFGSVLALFGIWAVLDFNSFWTVFHFLIFPDSLMTYLAAGGGTAALNSLNWVLDADCYMIRILEDLFFPLVVRCGLFLLLSLAVILLISLGLRLWDKKGRHTDDRAAEEDDSIPEPILPDAPDLVLAHKIRNASAEERAKLRERRSMVFEENTADHPVAGPDREADSDAEETANSETEGDTV